MTDTMNTYVSPPGGGVSQMPTAPGGGGAGGQMGMTSAVLWVIGGTAAIAFAASYAGRKGKAPTLGHLDVIDSFFNAATVAVWFGTAKVVAYRFHGHKISQAVLLVL